MYAVLALKLIFLVLLEPEEIESFNEKLRLSFLIFDLSIFLMGLRVCPKTITLVVKSQAEKRKKIILFIKKYSKTKVNF